MSTKLHQQHRTEMLLNKYHYYQHPHPHQHQQSQPTKAKKHISSFLVVASTISAMNKKPKRRTSLFGSSKLPLLHLNNIDIMSLKINETEKPKGDPQKATSRFRKAVHMIQLLLQAVSRIRTRSVDDKDVSNLHRVIKYDLIFDLSIYRRPKERGLPDEAKRILKMASSERTDELIRIAVAGLIQTIPEYGDFPSNIQKSIARVCNLDQFEAGRVIIRQGHKADNFYLIVSGITAVIKSDRNQYGEHVSNTVAFLNKGKTFGELAIMHQSARNATVTCQSDVSVLTIDRDDFLDIFMHIEKGKEPEHISYLRKLDILYHWPINKLPYDNTRICLLTYFRKGVVMCKDSNNHDWLYIIKNGSCRILKSLKAPIKTPYKERQNATNTYGLNSIFNPRTRRNVWHEVDILPILFDSQVKPGSENRPMTATNKRKVMFLQNKTESKSNEETASDENIPKIRQRKSVFIEIQKLYPKDIFGLVNIVFESIGQSTNVALVSEGAECILINKHFFVNNMNDDFRKHLRRTVQPYPSEEELETKLQIRTDWQSYKSYTLHEYFVQKRKLQNFV